MLLCLSWDIRKGLGEVRGGGRFITEDPITINPRLTLTASCRLCDLAWPFPASAVNHVLSSLFLMLIYPFSLLFEIVLCLEELPDTAEVQGSTSSCDKNQ